MPTILVLDDDQVILDLLQTVLSDAGYNTTVAPEIGRIAPDATADLVITDLVPLKASQREAALGWVAALRTRIGGSPVGVVTAHAAAVGESDMLGADAIISKPFDVDMLLAKVDELLRLGHIRKTP